jgi:hypothetical protein
MSTQVKKVSPTLKHGGYSAKAILPGESRAGFRRLHRDIIAELRPDGALEHDIVRTIVQLVWRKQNLATFRKVELVKERYWAIKSQRLPPESEPFIEDQAQKEFGQDYHLLEIAGTATLNRLTRELEIEERLDAMIDRQLKRLLFLRGLKSLPSASSSTPSNILPAPKKVA